jgi:hypothetical protein
MTQPVPGQRARDGLLDPELDDAPARVPRSGSAAQMGACAVMSEMWNSVAPGWEANAGFVDEQLAVATGELLDAAWVSEVYAVLDLAAGPGGAGLAAAERVGSSGSVAHSRSKIPRC